MRKNHSFLHLVALLLVSAICIQIGASLAKYMFAEVGGAGASALRLIMATSLLCLYWRPWLVKFTSVNWSRMWFFGIALGIMNLSIYLAIERIPLGIAVALEFIGPIGVALLGARKLVDFFWVLLVVAGLWFLLPFATDTELDLIGVGFALSAGFCWAIYIVFGAKASHSFGVYAPSVGISIAALVVVPVGVVSQGLNLFASPYVLMLAVIVAILSTIIPYSIEMHVITKMPSRVFSILMCLEPVIATVVGMIVLHEMLSLSQAAGVFAIVIASLGATLGIKRNY